jgi:type III pantothenate kinase
VIALVDAGNARLKWACLDGAALTNHGHALLVGDAASAVAALRARVGAPSRVLIANVAGAEVGALLAEAFGSAAQFVTPRASFAGVTCGYREPQRLGVDRWLAVIAAYQKAADWVCVVDAGTALTADAVSGRGEHQGGLILPGLGLMADSLQQRTSDIGSGGRRESPPGGLALFGRSTEEAVTRAALLASAALVDRCVEQLEQAAGHAPRLMLTGGDGEALMPWLESHCEFHPHLVLDGLALMARADSAADP